MPHYFKAPILSLAATSTVTNSGSIYSSLPDTNAKIVYSVLGQITLLSLLLMTVMVVLYKIAIIYNSDQL